MKPALPAFGIALLALTPAIGQDPGAYYRLGLQVPLLLSDGPTDPVTPFSISAQSIPGIGTTGDEISASISIAGGKAPYNVELTGASVPPLISATTSGISGTLTAGSFSFAVKATDSSSPPRSVTVDPPWHIDVADAISVAGIDDITVEQGAIALMDQPAVSGGTAPFSMTVVPGGQGVNIESGKIRVQRSELGAAYFSIAIIDAVGRSAQSETFSVTVNAAPVPVQENSDLYISSVISGGSLVKGATSPLMATASGKSGNLTTRPALRLSAGQSVTVTYDRVVTANRFFLDFHGPTETTCSNTTPQYQYAAGGMDWRLETSLDGTTWHSHTEDIARFDQPWAVCGFVNGSANLDSGHKAFRFFRFTYIAGVAANGGSIGLDVSRARMGQ